MPCWPAPLMSRCSPLACARHAVPGEVLVGPGVLLQSVADPWPTPVPNQVVEAAVRAGARAVVQLVREAGPGYPGAEHEQHAVEVRDLPENDDVRGRGGEQRPELVHERPGHPQGLDLLPCAIEVVVEELQQTDALEAVQWRAVGPRGEPVHVCRGLAAPVGRVDARSKVVGQIDRR